jgi:DNA-binding MarR family transcriptional regulator
LERYNTGVPGRLQKELRQNRPFSHPAEEAFLALQRTADRTMRGVEETLGRFQLSHPQYNVLRILRGAGAAGLPCGEIGQRLVTRDPDITRLLDRLETRALVRRQRDLADRRVIRAFLTADGAALCHALDKPVRDAIRGSLGPLGKEKLARLIDLLEQARILTENFTSK